MIPGFVNNSNIVGRQHHHSLPDMVDTFDVTSTTIIQQSRESDHSMQEDRIIHGYDPKHQPRRQVTSVTVCLIVVLGMGWIVTIALAISLRVRNVHNEGLNKKDIPTLTNENNNNVRFSIRINCGATEPYTDTANRVWLADNDGEDKGLFSVSGRGYTYDAWSSVRNNEQQSFNSTLNITSSSANTIMSIAHTGLEGMGLYVNERYFIESGWYEIPVPHMGLYEVTLYFSENFYTELYQRTFDIFVERERIAQDYDILRATGGQNHTAAWLTYSVLISDHSVSIQLVSRREYAKINGIQVREILQL